MKQAFEALLQGYQAVVVQYCTALLDNAADGEDVAQEVFLGTLLLNAMIGFGVLYSDRIRELERILGALKSKGFKTGRVAKIGADALDKSPTLEPNKSLPNYPLREGTRPTRCSSL
jgi:hypothetical protein